MLAEAEAARPTSQPHLSWGVRESIRPVFPNFKHQARVSVGRAQAWGQWCVEFSSTKVSHSVHTHRALNPLTSLAHNKILLYNPNPIARPCHDQG